VTKGAWARNASAGWVLGTGECGSGAFERGPRRPNLLGEGAGLGREDRGDVPGGGCGRHDGGLSDRLMVVAQVANDAEQASALPRFSGTPS
jgi:hypothetical protein